MNFWTGFVKVANLLSKLDAQGGVAPRSPEEISAAQATDLRTLPKTVDGANCGSCRFMKILDPKRQMGMCQNPSVMQEVTERMLCSQWDSPGTLRNWDIPDAAQVEPPVEGQVDPATGMPMEGAAQPQIDPTTGQPIPGDDMSVQEAAAGAVPGQADPDADPTAEPAESTAEKPAKKPAAKKDKGDAGGNINIHVGGAGAEKKAAEHREYDGPHHSLVGAAIGGMTGHQAAKWLGVRGGAAQLAATALGAAKGSRSIGLSDYEFKKKRESAVKKFFKKDSK